MDCEICCNSANIVCYIRLFLILFSVTREGLHYLIVHICASLLDAFDGYVARKYNQTSILGACLDMIIDRMSTVIICSKIIRDRGIQIQRQGKSQENMNFRKFLTYTPNATIRGLIFCLVLDLLAHFMYFIASMLNNKSHKDPKNYFLKIYYKKWVLTSLVMMNEIFYVSMYGTRIGRIFDFGIYLSLPFFHLKNFVNILQFVESLDILSDLKIKKD
ncbi:CDP-diacylglycerol--inositol 3-phosphatidyltransferase [Dictyocoela muelleri]|nr:CDP-diacylglycerol--inositol 3-phosphatidyltransferase [Dictyocoela muelleri]